MESKDIRQRSRLKVIAALFTFLLSLLMVSGHFEGDGAIYAGMAESLSESRTFNLSPAMLDSYTPDMLGASKGVNGAVVPGGATGMGLAQAAILVLFSPIRDQIAGSRSIAELQFLVSLPGLLAGAWLAYLLYCVAEAAGFRFRTSLVIVNCILFGSFYFPAITGGTNTELFIAPCVLQALLFARRKPTVVGALALGFVCGLPTLFRSAAAPLVLVPVLILLSRPLWRKFIVWVGLGGLLSTVVVLWSNYVRFGDALSMGYDRFLQPGKSEYLAQSFSLKYVPVALSGFVVSPAKSIFIYAPFFLLLFGRLRDLLRSADAAILLASAALYTIPVLMFRDWTGDTSWGPRYLLPVVPLVGAALLQIVIPMKKWIWTGVAGFLANIPGNVIFYPFVYGQVQTESPGLDFGSVRFKTHWDWRAFPVREGYEAIAVAIRTHRHFAPDPFPFGASAKSQYDWYFGRYRFDIALNLNSETGGQLRIQWLLMVAVFACLVLFLFRYLREDRQARRR